MTRAEYVGIVDGLRTWNVYDDSEKCIGQNQSAPDMPPVVPESVTAAQIRKWLVRHGIELEQVTSAIAALPDSVRKETQIEWEYEPVIHRSSSMLAQMAAGFGMDAAAIDAAFIEAASL
jgi:hypothetical protein